MKYKLNFGCDVAVIPAAAAEKILSGAASVTESAVLMAIVLEQRTETENEAQYIEMLSGLTGASMEAVTAALAFWRGAGVIFCEGSMITEANTENKSSSHTADSNAATAKGSSEPSDESAVSSPANNENLTEKEGTAKRKKLMREELPNYASEELSKIVSRDGGALSSVIDQCSMLLGRVFNPTEISIFAAMNDYLGLEPDYILTMCAYYAQKKPNCKLHYIEKAAYTLVNDGITTLEALDAHIKSMELYDGIAGHLRRLIGIGERAFTKKENAKINHWINELGYGSDIIEYCYEITVDSIGEFSFDYADRILDGWYLAGVRDIDAAKKANEEFHTEHSKQAQISAENTKGANPSAVSTPSFDGDEFLKLAVKRSIKTR